MRKKEITNAEKVDTCIEDIKESCVLIKKNIEGYTLEGYKETFERIYGFYNPDLLVYVVKFETI